MISHDEVVVQAKEFIEAATRAGKIKRAPAGARSSIPTDTLLSPAAGGVMVEMPMVSTLVSASTNWTVQVSVDSKKLIAVCDTMTKLGATKEPGDKLMIGVKESQLTVKYKTTRVSLPTVWVKGE